MNHSWKKTLGAAIFAAAVAAVAVRCARRVPPSIVEKEEKPRPARDVPETKEGTAPEVKSGEEPSEATRESPRPPSSVEATEGLARRSLGEGGPPSSAEGTEGLAVRSLGEPRPKNNPGVPYVLSRPGRGAKEYFVDVKSRNASDAGPGSREAPFKSIGKAAEVVEAGDVVTIRAGTYREGIGIKKTGTKERPIVFQAEKKGAVVVTGADPLTGWRKEPGERPVYSVHWPHDFVINSKVVDGKRVLIREHGSEAPVGCAEEVIWDSRPLRQVMTRDGMRPGTFHVDWDDDRLHVWLPGGVDPRTTEVLGCTRGLQFGRGGYWGHWAEAKYVTLKGITFRYAANFAQRGAVKAYTGWRVEDCVIEWNNAGGIAAEGDDIVFLRVVSQDNGWSGIGGGGKNILVKDCISRRNNWKGFKVGWAGGGGKFLRTAGLRIVNHTAYENVGPGIWLDWSNRDYVIENCVSYGNCGNRHSWEGMGIFTEANDGPGRIVNNIVYSNTGSGISIAESQNLVVEKNVLVDNGANIDFRAMEGRADHKLENVVVRDNRFKNWRGAAISTSLGTWDMNSAAGKKLTIEGNVYDPPAGKPLFDWARQKISSLEEARKLLGVEKTGRVARVPFGRKLVASRTRAVREGFGIDEAIGDARPGDTVFIPANGRTSIVKGARGWTCQVYDLANRYVTLTLPTARIRSAVERTIAAYPMTEAVYLKVRITRRDAGGIEATVLDLGGDVRREALGEMDRKKAAAKRSTWLEKYPLAARARARDWRTLDLTRHANRPLSGRDGWVGHPLRSLPAGRHTIHGVPFLVVDGAQNRDMVAVGLRSEKFTSTRGRPLPREVRIGVGRRARAVYFLHGAGYAGDHVKVAEYEFAYTDGTKDSVDIVPYGKPDPASAARLAKESTIQDWWPGFPQFGNENVHQAEISDESGEYRRSLYTLQWVNPHPGKAIRHIRLASEPGRGAFVLVLGITVLKG